MLSGHVVGSGARFRIAAAEGATLTLHVFGATAPDGTRGAGAYTLDIDVLPQVVSVQAQAVLAGAPATSIVLTLQGDRLDPAAAQDPAELHRPLVQAGRHARSHRQAGHPSLCHQPAGRLRRQRERQCRQRPDLSDSGAADRDPAVRPTPGARHL